jgi:hypothetical protein
MLRTYRHLVHVCAAELALNLNKVAISDWEGRQPRKVVVPAALPGETIHHEVPRNMKQISMIACVSVAGESFTSYIAQVCSDLRVAQEA